LELFLEIPDAVLERSYFFFHKASSLLNEVGFYKKERRTMRETLSSRKSKSLLAALDHGIVLMLDRRKLRGNREKTDKKNQTLRIKRPEAKNDQIQDQA